MTVLKLFFYREGEQRMALYIETDGLGRYFGETSQARQVPKCAIWVRNLLSPIIYRPVLDAPAHVLRRKTAMAAYIPRKKRG